MENPKIRPIAMYLPQYHPIPENDAWWGKGFTEWRNVVKAKPRFKGHYQPHLPADLGFYDLRLEEARLAQEALAKQYGIYGFCYYHYWFNGKRLLNEPIDRKIKNPKEDLPFMFCWANENWTRAWDGGENEILIEQKYSHDDDENHIRALIPYFKDERYIKVDGKPVFVIYKDALFPDIKRTLEIFREEAGKHGIGLYLCKFDLNEKISTDYTSFGFDAAIEFQPFTRQFSDYNNHRARGIKKYFVLNNYLSFVSRKVFGVAKSRNIKDRIIDFERFVNYEISNNHSKLKVFPGVCPGWDNSSRRPKNKALIFNKMNPDLFKGWVLFKLENFNHRLDEENFLFINAWNEWAEGNHLEPCEKWGHSYLVALRDAIRMFNK